MNTTPLYGWPYAQDTDPVKQFPSTVDSVRTLAIETALSQSQGRTTGWRNISSLLTNGFAGTIMLQRTGYIVSLTTFDLGRATAVTTPPIPVIANAPAGFYPSLKAAYVVHTNVYNAASGTIQSGCYLGPTTDPGKWLLVGGFPANGKMYETFLYPTDDAWPTTLPGNPA